MTTVETEYVRFDEQTGGYVVSGHAEIATLLREPGWSSDPRRNPLAPNEIRELPASILLFMDPPDHTRLRRLVSPAFTPRVLNALRPRVADVVTAALEQLDDDADLLDDFAYIVPLAVIAEFLDVGAEGAAVFRDFTPDLVRILEMNPTPAELAAGTEASIEMLMYLTPVIAHRRQHPGADFISLLLMQDDITVEEVASTCILLLAAGHETTANLIANGTKAILEQPAQREHLLADPARAVEELLRLEGAVKFLARTATENHRIGDHELRPGDLVLADLAAANTDPRRYVDPHRLDLARKPQQHLAFGGGSHFCLGAALSRMEGVEALPALFARYPGMRLAGTPVWRDSITFRALDALPLRLR